ncbi:winged helix-turn-helix domain-containing protein [Enterococcus sp. 5H]|uniref:winged helix-turn-helix domain-containing protein n=1 Tax=Enterococcus sp. 5H TaxID=1229490 RepID=UPI002303B982|nr:winged helix-turn-helix domain-containing protein [Enterococcus sp. 5H]MDA9470586.1 transcriptional regulator [Enterococcus sp. 5H]
MVVNILVLNSGEDVKFLNKQKQSFKNIDVSMFSTINLTEEAFICDGIVLIEGNSQNLADVFQILWKIKEHYHVPFWVVGSDIKSNAKEFYLRMGALGIFTSLHKELELVIINYLECFKKIVNAEGDIVSQKGDFSKSIHLNPRNHSVRINDSQEILLTRLEYKTFELLYKNRGEGVAYEEIFKVLWGPDYNGCKYRVANMIFHLRKKFELAGAEEMIRTVRTQGYILI